MNNITRKKLSKKITIEERRISEYVPWENLSDDDLVLILSDLLRDKYTNEYQRLRIVYEIIDLKNISLGKEPNLYNDMKTGLYEINWIVPIVNDNHIVYNKIAEKGDIVQKVGEIEQGITNYQKSIIGQNDTESIIKAFSGYINNIESKDGINITLRNNRVVYSINTGRYRIAHEQEDIKLVGFLLDTDNFMNHNRLINEYPSNIYEDLIKLKINYKPKTTQFLFNTPENYEKDLKQIVAIYAEFLQEKNKVYQDFYKTLDKINSTVQEKDKTLMKKYKIESIKDSILKNKDLVEIYGNYPLFNIPSDSDLTRILWLHTTPDNGILYYLIDDKEYKELIDAQIDYSIRKINLEEYYTFMKKTKKDFNIELQKYFWFITISLGENRFKVLLQEAKEKNVSIQNILTKNEQKIIDEFIDKYNKYISKEEEYCEWNRLRKAIDNTTDIIKKGTLFNKLMEGYAKKDSKNEVIYPKPNDKDQLIYPSKKCNEKNFACNHEKIMYIDIPNSDNPEKLQTLIREKFEVANEDENTIDCKFCERIIRIDIGSVEQIEYQDSVGVIREGVESLTENSVINKIKEYLFLIGRPDLNARELTEQIISFINTDLLKQKGKKDYQFIKDIIEVSYIVSILIHTIINSQNKFLNTTIAPIVNYTKQELINYFLKATEKIFSTLYTRIKTVKLPIYNIISTRFDTLYEDANFLNEKNKRKVKLSETLDYVRKIEEYKPNNKFEKIIETRKVNDSDVLDLYNYLGHKYINRYQNQFYKKRSVDVDTLNMKEQHEYLDIITDTNTKKLLNNYTEMLDNIEKGYHKKVKMTLSTGRNNVFPSINTKFEKIDEKNKIIEFFLRRSLDGSAQEYTTEGYSLVDGRFINDIANPSEKEFERIKKTYYELRKQDKSNVFKINDIKFDKYELPKELKKDTEINEPILKTLVEKVLIKTHLVALVASSSSETETAEDKIDAKTLTDFMLDLGYYTNLRDDEIYRAKDDTQRIIINKKYDKMRKDLLKRYLNDIFIYTEILKNKNNLITVKNTKGLEFLEKYLEYEPQFKKVDLGYTIEDIEEISRINDLSDKKRGNVLLNLLVNSLLSNSTISQEVNLFITEYIFNLVELYNSFNVTQNDKNDLNKKIDDDIFNYIKKINNITDETRVELGINFIDLRKVSDPTEFVDIIEKVDEYQVRREINTDVDLGDVDMNDEEVELNADGFD
jgi:hypothetical protein